jgi:hypothetical protein
MDPTQLWQRTLDELALQMPRATFDNWLRGTHCLGRENGTLLVKVRNQQAIDWLSSTLAPAIQRTLKQITDEPLEAHYLVADEAPTTQEEESLTEDNTLRDAQISVLSAALQQIQDPEARAVIKQQIVALGGAPPEEKSTANWTPIDVDTSGRWFPVPEYANRFWAPLLGRVAFRVWMIVRQHDTRPARVKAQDEWTPARRFTAPELAREVPCGTQAVKGVWRRCEPSHPDAVLRKPRRIIKGEDAPEQRYYRRQSGALDTLETEGLALVKAQGRRRHKTFEVQVRITPPVLSPLQVTQLNEELQVAHDRWLLDSGVDLDEWRQDFY